MCSKIEVIQFNIINLSNLKAHTTEKKTSENTCLIHAYYIHRLKYTLLYFGTRILFKEHAILAVLAESELLRYNQYTSIIRANKGESAYLLLLFFSMKHIIEINSCRGNHQARYPAVLYLSLLYLLLTLF